MFRRRLAQSVLLAGTLPLVGLGCAKELDITEPVDPASVVQAQFDPTNTIPVLRIVPTPTAIVQNPLTGDLTDAVAPRPCEGPSTKQCLAFINGGWPTTTPITLFFSGDVDDASAQAGIKLFKSNGAGMAPTPVPFTATFAPRPPIPEACFEGGNGTNPEQTFTAAQVPPGTEVLILSPSSPLEPGQRYFYIVTNEVKDANGNPVEPSSLFYLLNQPATAAPVQSDGTITSGLLRSSVEGKALFALFPGKSPEVLTDEEKATLAAAVMSSGRSLFGLYTLFSQVVDPLVASGIPRESIIFANTWTTSPDTSATAPVVAFDPTNSVVPFPNLELLTVPDAAVAGGLRTNLPNPTMDPVIGGLNTLNGFSTTAPISIPVSAAPDPTSIDPSAMTPCTADDCNIVMLKLAEDGTVDTAALPVPLVVLTASTSITVVPAIPLLQNARYVVAVKSGLETVDGTPFSSPQTYSFLKIPAPFIDAGGNVLEAPINERGGTFKAALACSQAAVTGQLLSDAQVQGLATLLETQLAHSRWLETFAALESGSIARTDLLMGFGYKTQSITDVVDFAKQNLEREAGCGATTPCWDDLLAGQPRLIPAGVDLRGVEAQAAVCLPLCQGGGTPPIPPANCAALVADVLTHPVCQAYASRIDRIRLFLLATFDATVGGPFQTTPGSSGTFTPTALVQPEVSRIPMWVITGTTADPNAQYPVVVFQHGLGAAKETGFLHANTLASTITPLAPAGYATVLIDLPFHGSRASDLINNTTQLPCDVDPADVTCTDPDGPGPQPTACVGGCDGAQDPSGTGYLGVNLFATRDNFRQSTIDQLALIRALRLESDAGGALADLDTTHLGYIGQSLGGITGGNLAAFLGPDEIDAMVLNVPGGGLVFNILLKTVPQIAGPLYAALAARGICEFNVPGNPASGCKPTPAFNQFTLVAQWVLDPGDPYAASIGVVHELAAGRTPLGANKVLIQMSMPDPVVSNDASYALARGYGFTPGVSDNFQTYDFTSITRPEGSGCHSFLLAPICGACLNDLLCTTFGAQIQASTFVASGGAIVAPQKQDLGALDCDNPCP